jgi:agmatinase
MGRRLKSACLGGYFLDRLDADIAVFGIPFDLRTQYRSGARFGPNGIREGSSLCRVSPHLVFDHEDNEAYLGPDYKIIDCGDIDMLYGDTEFCFENIREFV